MDNSAIKVLLVEDDEDDYLITKDLLAEIKNRQMILEWVNSYETALTAIAQTEYDVYLLDYCLGDHSGLELLQEMRSHGIENPVIFITGQGAYEVDVQVMNAGAADYLVKGRIDAEQLERSIRYAWERSRTLAQLRQSEERYRAIVEDQTELICRFLPNNGELTFVNPAYCRYFNTSEAHLLGKSFFAQFPLPERTKFLTHFQSLSREKPVVMIETHWISAGGKIKTLLWTNRAIFEGSSRVVEYQSVGQDISDRKQLEEALQQANAALGMAVEERTTQLDDAIARLQQEIIKHKQTAESLRESEAKNRVILNAIPDLLFRVGADGTFLDYLPTSNMNLLVPPQEFLGKKLQDVLPPKVAEMAIEFVQKTLVTGQPQVFDYQLNKRGEDQDYQARIVLSGELEVLVLVSDISDRKRVERALVESEERFRTSIETMLDCFGIYSAVRDETGQIIDFLVEYVNRAACEINHLSKTEQIDKRLCEILPAHRDSELFTAYCELVETGQPLVKESLFYQETLNHQRWEAYFDIRAVKLGDGIAVAWRDISDRKHGENALKQALKELNFQKFALDQAALVSMTDSTGLITDANDKFCRIFQYSRSELLGENHRILNSGYHSPQFFKELWQTISRGKVWQGEIKNKTKDGSFLWVDTTIVPFAYDAKKPFRYLAIQFDITNRKQAEVEILNALAKEKELSELKSRFVAMTSHEFRTPLTTIQSAAELLEYYGYRWTEADRLEQLHYIQSAVQHMTHLLDDVLVIGNAEGGNLEFNPMPINLVRICDRLIGELKLTKLKQHAIAFIKPNQTCNGTMDQKLLRLILGNLLSNAAKYSSPGTTIRFELSCEDPNVIFEIQDQGIGISEVDQQHLFDFFYRASNVGTIPGTGLGLAIVKKCVDLQGGHIHIWSQLGVGTTVRVMLPLHGKAS